MSDTPARLPPGWPTEEQRSRVAVRAHALRNRRLALRTTSVTIVVALLGGGFALVHSLGNSRGVTIVTGPTTAPAIRSDPVPKGWRIVDYGDARLAAPPGWSVIAPGASGHCAAAPKQGFTVFREDSRCSSIIVEPLTASSLPSRALRTVHGIKLYAAAGGGLRYAAPALGVRLTVRGAETDVLLETLTSSARRVVLSAGPAPTAPDDWRTVEFAGITLRVPPTMPLKRLGASDVGPGVCSTQTFVKPGAYIGNGFPGAIHCPMIPAGVVPKPTDGVWISNTPERMPSMSRATVIDLPTIRLRVEISKSVLADPMLTIEPSGPLDGLPALIRLGLGPDPTIARTILYSIRASAN